MCCAIPLYRTHVKNNMERKDDKGNILIYQSQDETIAQRGCCSSFC